MVFFLTEPHAAEMRLQRSSSAVFAGLSGDARGNSQRVRPPWVARHKALRHLLAAQDLQVTQLLSVCHDHDLQDHHQSFPSDHRCLVRLAEQKQRQRLADRIDSEAGILIFHTAVPGCRTWTRSRR